MASWLVCSPLDRAVGVQAQAWDILLCSWARNFTRSKCLCPSTCINGYWSANLMLGV